MKLNILFLSIVLLCSNQACFSAKGDIVLVNNIIVKYCDGNPYSVDACLDALQVKALLEMSAQNTPIKKTIIQVKSKGE